MKTDLKPTDPEYIEALAKQKSPDFISVQHTICEGYQLALSHTNHAELVEALKGLLKGINYSDACRGKFANFYPKGTNEHKEALKKAYVGSKGIPSDEQILRAIEALTKSETSKL